MRPAHHHEVADTQQLSTKSVLRLLERDYATMEGI